MALLPFKLNAVEQGTRLSFKDAEILIREAYDAIPDFNYRLEREEILRAEKTCTHCPRYILLTEEINKVVERMAKDPKVNTGIELPAKVNKLKFLFYTQLLRDSDGNKRCLRSWDTTPDLRPTKLDGQFKLMAEDVLRFGKVTDIQYINPEAEETVYYFRGEGLEKDIVIQAILTKDGGKFRYFRHITTKEEENPYNLPDLNGGADSGVAGAPQLIQKGAPPSKVESADSENKTSGNALVFKAEVEKLNKFIPKNVHFIEATLDQEIFGGVKLKGSSDTSLKGNTANFKLKGESGNDLIMVDLHTKVSGKTEGRVIIPYAIRVFDESPWEVKGDLRHENGSQILTMSLAEQSTELIRSEYRKNPNGVTSYVLAKDFQTNPDESYSVQYGKGEDNNRYASFKHTKLIKNKVAVVVDVRVGEGKTSSLVYRAEYKF